MIYYTEYDSFVGRLVLASDGKSLKGLWMEGHRYLGQGLDGHIEFKKDLKIFDQTKAWLDRYFAGENPPIGSLDLDPVGTGFRKLVWSILKEIPYGQTVTYGQVAKKVAKLQKVETMSSQAIGGAIGHNPISIIIPCHRVLGAKGNLTGYGGGLPIKARLLSHEGIKLREPIKYNNL